MFGIKLKGCIKCFLLHSIYTLKLHIYYFKDCTQQQQQNIKHK